MANLEDFGTITRAYTDRWGAQVDIALDDGRKWRGVHVCIFSPAYKGHGGTRFVTKAAYDQYQKEKIKQMKVDYEQVIKSKQEG